ncbi:MAG: STAS domain-containing protein [Oscillospiraceae bacterium]|nr:STAS domain-containing protein [Oscillospiraceae bacterium]
MTITKTKKDKHLTLALEGSLDKTTAADLEAVISNELDGIQSLTFDMSGLEYISSAGLRALLFAQQTMSGQGSMTVKNCSDVVMEIFTVTGFTEVMNIQ